ncbi:uncharacterized protein LOC130734019 isoform X2 [Lotus japonicus]|uniref:uncharacterized protein LOC130734019 isoform X2 n=1 Tax=Lotus japonicus TaxID=34305 RepID=UPI0025828CC0|nr:uncharacterized protein LOC130734019 isoform X2 [Lotus japonicus]
MGLNAKDIQIRLFIMLQVSVENSYTYMKKHPLFWGALSILFIMYIFLSYIYNLVVFLSPYLVCTAILVRIFWSSEQTQLKYVQKKGEKERVEPKKQPKMFRNERRGFLYKCPSHSATSRRRNFTRKKLDVYGGLEEKAKDLSEVFRNEFTNRNIDMRRAKFFETELDISDYKFSGNKLEAPTQQPLFSEPSMVDLVTCDASCEEIEKKIGKREDEKKAQEDGNKEFLGDDQKNQMDLGDCEMERTKRLESLIARRRARKQLKMQLEKGLINAKTIKPSLIAPLFITRVNPFDSPREFEGIDSIEMPGSAPSALRSPFDIPYDPFEEKPILTGGSFNIEFTSKDLLLEPRQDPDAREKRLVYPTVRMLPGYGNHDMPEQFISKESSENEKPPRPPYEEEETTHKEDGKCKTHMAGLRGEEIHNADAAKSKLDHTNDSNLILITPNVESVVISGKQGSSASSNPQETVLDFPISSNSATNINDSLYESLSTPVGKNKEELSFNGRSICHTPSCSLASDLQVEVSEVGSSRLTSDIESHELITSTDGESSIVYDDGDADKDVTSGSEDMWGASLHSREVHGASEHDVLEGNNWRDFGSPMSIQNAADVSSMSSRSDMPEDTPTHAEWSNQSENLLRKAPVINDVNNLESTEQDNTQDTRSNEDNTSVARQEATGEVSISSSSSSSPRSVLPIPQKNMADQVSSSANNQEIHQGVQQPNMEDMVQETLNGEAPPYDSMPQNIQPPTGDPTYKSQNNNSSHSQEPNISSKMNGEEVCSKEDENKLKNDENNEDKFTPLKVQDASAEPPGLEGLITSQDMKEKSRELFDDKVPLISLMLESSSEIHRENEEKSQASVREEASTEKFINADETGTSSANDFEGKHNDLNENETLLSSCIPEEERDKLSEKNKENHCSEEVNYLQSESKQEVKDHLEKENLDKDDISEDSPLPMVTEVTNNAEDTIGESEKMNKDDATDQEFNKNHETMVLSEPEREVDHVSNISHE